ncbi:MAG: hypothetical protein OJF50_005947 [Nitrospira sp.]|nr:hypothetical protein [Nitrospira sp.]
MARVTQLGPVVEAFIQKMIRHLDDIERERRWSKRMLRVKNHSGRVVEQGKKIGSIYHAYTPIFFHYFEEGYLKISLYDDLKEKNEVINVLAREIIRQVGEQSPNASTTFIVHCGLEAHHFVPANLLERWPLLQHIFDQKYRMPAVNLTRLEHRGNLMLLARLREEGTSLPGILEHLPPEQRLESVTTALANIDKDVRAAFPGELKGERMRTATKRLLDEIEKLYEERFTKLMDTSRDFDGDNNWTMRKWFKEIGNVIATTPVD